MQCGNPRCGVQLAEARELFFFVQSDTSVHLSLKPELREVVTARGALRFLPGERRGIQQVVCAEESCGAVLGKELPHGPNGASFVAFGLDKIVLLGIRYGRRGRARDLVNRLVEIEKRDMQQFFSHDLQAAPVQPEAPPTPQGPIRFASIDRPEDFEWRDLLLSDDNFSGRRQRRRRRHYRKPRRYQLEAFAESLQRNLVLVMPTGSGKTLVASLLLARMRRLNPSLMGVLLVERVPLVFQQARSLESDTGLRVAALCGENATDNSVRRIRDGSHDLLVATAGLLLSRVQEKRDLDLTAFSCIVLDECHHAGSGGHNFSRVLDLLNLLPAEQRPRLLGLTASPIELRDMESGENRLARFLARFPPGTGLFRPAEARAQAPTVLEVPVERSAVLDAFLEEARQLLLTRLRNTNLTAGNQVLETWLSDTAVMIRKFGRVLGHLRAQRYNPMHCAGPQADQLRELMALMDVIDVARTLGLSFAVPLLQRELPGLAAALLQTWLRSPQAAGWEADRSGRLRALEEELTRLGEQSRALVFVTTRRTAKLLVSSCLAEQFRELRPQICIGQGGPDGMRWEDEQELALERFNSGISRLIVSTSVLEEGLDVGECDVVIRFDAARSLVQLVQSRGRARRPGSRFVVVADADERAAAQRLRRREAALDALLGRESMEAGGPCPATVAIVERVTADQSDEEEDAEEQQNGAAESANPNSSSIWSFSGRHLVLRLFVDLRDSGLKELARSLEEARFFRISRIDQFASSRSATGISGVFPATTSVVVACIDSGGGGGGGGGRRNVPLLRWWRFCRQWSFRHSGCPVFALPLVAEADATDEVLLPMVGMSVGRFERESEIRVAAEFNQGEPKLRCMPATLSDPARGFAVEFYAGQLKIRVAAPVTNGFALVDWQLSLVAVPIRFCPEVLLKLDGMENEEEDPDLMNLMEELPAVADANLFLDAQANCQLLLLRLGDRLLTPGGWLSLRRHFPVPLLETRLSLLQDAAAQLPAGAGPDQAYSEIDKPQPPKRPRLLDTVMEAGFDCRWLLRVVLDGRRVRLCSAAFLEPVRQDIDRKIDEADLPGLLRLAAGLRQLMTMRAFLSDPAARLETCRHLLQYQPPDQLALLQPVAPSETVSLLRALVSPTRVVCLPPVPVASSRLLRRWVPGGKRFMLVAFTDEAGNSVRNVSSKVRNRFRRVLIDGLHLAGRCFRFLSASGSQLRSQRCLFVDADDQEEITAMRCGLVGDPLNYNSAPKYLARLALFHTGDKPTVDLPLARVGRVKDRQAGNGDLLTDGCGKISRCLAARIAECLGYTPSSVPSAYQFRYAGAKGVLVVVDPDRDAEFQDRFGNDIDVLLRPSMEKFRCNTDTQLCIVQAARALPVCLNREAVTLLESLSRRAASLDRDGAQWDLASRLHELQEAALARASESLAGGDASRQALQEYIEPHQVKEVASRFDLASEPHWRSLLRLAFQFSVIDLRTRTALPVAQGCRVMGAADPTGLLAEGEVYLRVCQEEDGVTETVEGRVLIYRNPCLHPGDLRIARAVTDRERPELRQWVNVLLIPARSECRASLAADCSGGDLDGDQFSVIWDQELVPPMHALHPALNYAELAANPPVEPDGTDVSAPELLANFYLANLENTFLGRVAHMHLALCDQLPDGAVDPLARKLAESQSVAVDFPKTGIVPQVPKEALKKVKEFGYPDFMEKPASETYQSEKLLGQLYRRCRTYAMDWDLLEQAIAPPATSPADTCSDPVLSWPGWERFESKARIELSRYRMEVRALLGQWGLASERELALARSLRWHSTLRADLGAAQRGLQGTRDALFARYRREFESDPALAGGGVDKQRAKAAAWYLVAAREARQKSADSSCDIDLDDDIDEVANGRRRTPLGLSFPWVVADILCEIGNVLAKSAAAPSAERNLQLDVGRSALASLRESLPALTEAVGRADSAAALVATAIDATVPRSGLRVVVYGSASVFLCDAVGSDVDLCVTTCSEVPPQLAGLTTAELQRHWLRNAVSPALDRVATAKEELLADNRIVPLIRCLLTVDGDDAVACDLSMNTVGLEKTRFLLSLYAGCPHRLPLLRLLVDWARAAGVVRSAEDEENDDDGGGGGVDGERRVKMPTAEFYALALHCLQLEYDGAGVLVGSFRQLGQPAGQLGQPAGQPAGQLAGQFAPPRPSLATQLAVIADQLQLPDAGADADAAAALGARIVSFFRSCAGLDGHVTYRWPIPSGQSVTIAAGAVRYAARCARAALLRLHYARDVAMVTVAAAADLRGGSDVGAGARFAKTLPNRLSQELGRAVDFHEARLASATGCGRVQLVPLPDRPPLLRLTAEGDAAAVARLRREVRLMAGAAGWLLRTCHRRRACRYFMDGASLLQAVDCLSDECRFRLVNCVSGVVGDHRLKPASLLRCSGVDCPGRDVWLEAAARRLFLVMSRQLSGLPTDRPDLAASLEVSARPGQFYLLNADESLPATQCSLSLSEISAYVAKGQKYRRNAERQPFEPPEPQPPPPGERDQVDQVPMVPLTGGGRGQWGERTVPTPRPSPAAAKSTRRNRRLGCGFRCGLYRLQSAEASGASTAERLRRRCQQPAEGDVSIFASALLRLGFQETEAPVALPHRQGHDVKVSVRVSASFEVVLCHDSSLKLDLVEERQLNWVHATVLDTYTDDNQHGGGVDTRISVTTATSVAPDSKLHLKLFGDAAERFAYIRAAPGDRVRVSERVPSPMRDRIVGIRHRRRARWFHLAGGGGGGGGDAVDVCLAEGDFYPSSGPDCDPFVDMSLHFRPDAILSRQSSVLAGEAFRIVKLCDQLRDVIKAEAAAAAANLR